MQITDCLGLSLFKTLLFPCSPICAKERNGRKRERKKGEDIRVRVQRCFASPGSRCPIPSLTKWGIGHFRVTFAPVSSPRGKWTFPCEWFARRLLWGKKQLDNGLLKKDRAKLRAWFTDESTERGLRTVFNRSRLFESSAHQWQSVSARVWSLELALSLQSQ